MLRSLPSARIAYAAAAAAAYRPTGEATPLSQAPSSVITSGKLTV